MNHDLELAIELSLSFICSNGNISAWISRISNRRTHGRHVLNQQETNLVASPVEERRLDFDLNHVLSCGSGGGTQGTLTCLRSMLNPTRFSNCRSQIIASTDGGV